MFFIMLIGRYPFYATTPADLFEEIRKGVFTIPRAIKLSQKAKILLYGLIRREASERPEGIQLLKLLPKNTGSPLEEKFQSLIDGQKLKKLGKFLGGDDQVVPTTESRKT